MNKNIIIGVLSVTCFLFLMVLSYTVPYVMYDPYARNSFNNVADYEGEERAFANYTLRQSNAEWASIESITEIDSSECKNDLSGLADQYYEFDKAYEAVYQNHIIFGIPRNRVTWTNCLK